MKSIEAIVITVAVLGLVVLVIWSHHAYGERQFSAGYAAAQKFDRDVARTEAKEYEQRIGEANQGRRAAEDLLMLARGKPFGGLLCYKAAGDSGALSNGRLDSGKDSHSRLLPDKVVGDTEPKSH